MVKSLARLADAWNTGGGNPDDLKAKIAKLDAACEAEGRDPATVVRTVGATIAGDGYAGDPASVLTGTTEEVVASLREFETLGFQHVMVRVDPSTPENLAAMAPVVDAFYNGG